MFVRVLFLVCGLKNPERTCKPGSVSSENERRSFLYDHGCPWPLATYPRVVASRTDSALCLVLHRVGFTEPSESPRLLVRSYRTFSPLPRTEVRGGLFSVALSLTSRPVGVTHHPVLRCPDFPPVRLREPAIAQSSPEVVMITRGS